jgi:hypothetical protein
LRHRLRPIRFGDQPMENVPLALAIAFGFTTLIALWLFARSGPRSSLVLGLLVCWSLLQAAVGLTGFYTVTDVLPPRFLLLIGPPLVLVFILFLTPRGRAYLDALDPAKLILLHAIRIPVELTLYGLFLYKAVPELMTFTGRNFDILAGISAPVVYYFGYLRTAMTRRWLLFWNVVCLALLFNIVSIAILAAPLPFQQLAFDQPNIAVTHVPYVWLPGSIVPLVLLAHLASIRKLVRKG